MGGKSSSEQTQQAAQSSTQNPWEPAIPGLKALASNASGMVGNGQLTGAETGALNTLQGNANQGNPYASQMGILANDLFKGGPDRSGYATGSYDQYKASLDPVARGDYVDPSKNSALQGYLSTIGNDVSNRVNGMFAGAGRDMSGANLGALSRGLTEGMAPTLLNAYQGERNNQMSAIDKLYGAGGDTAGILSGLDQTSLANRQAGIGVGESANNANNSGANQTLAIEAMRRGIPMEQLTQLLGILGPLGGLGGTANSTGTANTQGSQTMSGAQQFANIAGGIGSMMPKFPMKFG